MVELDNEDDFAPEDYQDLEADLDTYAPKKKPAKAKGDESEDESTSDDERHEAYKVGDRNTA